MVFSEVSRSEAENSKFFRFEQGSPLDTLEALIAPASYLCKELVGKCLQLVLGMVFAKLEAV